MYRTVLGSRFTTAGVFAGILIEHDRFADLLIEEKDCRTYFNTPAAANAGFLIDNNTHESISSITIAAGAET